jgi:hypothetical protein
MTPSRLEPRAGVSNRTAWIFSTGLLPQDAEMGELPTPMILTAAVSLLPCSSSLRFRPLTPVSHRPREKADRGLQIPRPMIFVAVSWFPRPLTGLSELTFTLGQRQSLTSLIPSRLNLVQKVC